MACPSDHHVVLGTAGHIDHGKSEIVKYLTGTDTDRLKEEKERGMTTDLGFAFLGDDITIIDVPGHEKFVKTMVAGVNTVDLALLVVAADDGVMPQTVEHLEILNLLRIPAGLVALSKIDLVEKDWIGLVTDDIRNLLEGTVMENAPILPVSPITGAGMEELKSEIFRIADEVHAKQDKGIFRLPVDRVFSIKGFGTVAAGTILSGTLSPDDSVELLPQGKTIRVRGIQVHDRPVKISRVGFRTAINLQGLNKEDLRRGDVLAEPGFFRPTHMIDTHFVLLPTWKKQLKHRTRVRVHIGTNEIIARLILLDKKILEPGDEAFVQFHFEKPVVADNGDRYVVRSFSPVRTLGGGLVLDVYPPRHKRFDADVLIRLERRMSGDPSQLIEETLDRHRMAPLSTAEIARTLGLPEQEIEQRIEELDEEERIFRVGKKRWMSRASRDGLKHAVLNHLRTFHDAYPHRMGLSKAELRSRFKGGLDRMLSETILMMLDAEGGVHVHGDRIRLASHTANLSPKLETVKKCIEERLMEKPFSPPGEKELADELGKETKTVLDHMLETGSLVRLEEGVVMHARAVEKAIQEIRKYLQAQETATVSDIRQHLHTTRKYAVPLLIHLDGIGITLRDGDIRRLKE